jgi:hypothetical protein
LAGWGFDALRYPDYRIFLGVKVLSTTNAIGKVHWVHFSSSNSYGMLWFIDSRGHDIPPSSWAHSRRFGHNVVICIHSHAAKTFISSFIFLEHTANPDTSAGKEVDDGSLGGVHVQDSIGSFWKSIGYNP